MLWSTSCIIYNYNSMCTEFVPPSVCACIVAVSNKLTHHGSSIDNRDYAPGLETERRAHSYVDTLRVR